MKTKNDHKLHSVRKCLDYKEKIKTNSDSNHGNDIPCSPSENARDLLQNSLLPGAAGTSAGLQGRRPEPGLPRPELPPHPQPGRRASRSHLQPALRLPGKPPDAERERAGAPRLSRTSRPQARCCKRRRMKLELNAELCRERGRLQTLENARFTGKDGSCCSRDS